MTVNVPKVTAPSISTTIKTTAHLAKPNAAVVFITSFHLHHQISTENTEEHDPYDIYVLRHIPGSVHAIRIVYWGRCTLDFQDHQRSSYFQLPFCNHLHIFSLTITLHALGLFGLYNSTKNLIFLFITTSEFS